MRKALVGNWGNGHLARPHERAGRPFPRFVDISADTARQTVIAAGTEEVYQGHPKPSYCAVAAMTRFVGDAEFIRQDGGRMVYIYRQSGSIVVTKGGAVDLLLVGGGEDAADDGRVVGETRR